MFFIGQQSVVSSLTARCGYLLSPFMFVYHREAGCTWVKGADCMAVLYILCAVVAAELCGRSCCMLLQSCAVYCAFLLGQDVCANMKIKCQAACYQIIL